jgi:biopolymer transport protein ExbB
METNAGLMHMWQQGDDVTRFVALLLLFMSLASWVVMLLKGYDQIRIRQQAKSVRDFWESPDFETGLQCLGPQADNVFRNLAEQGQDARLHVENRDGAPHLHEKFDLSDWITRSLQIAIDDAHSRMQNGLGVLASVGSTAPFVGLFGTVWGIYHALMGIGLAGQATIDQVAGPIGESLIMTALGLAVAIPAVLGYNALVRGNKSLQVQLRRFAHDLHAFHVTGARVTLN